tara:strand:+ start:1496 stop:1684 length:189 start_codon:yes stop_codon:yes gene_type:complete
MEDKEVPFIITAIVVVYVVGIVVGYAVPDHDVKSKAPINPTLEITIENGVTDTTYIYKTTNN